MRPGKPIGPRPDDDPSASFRKRFKLTKRQWNFVHAYLGPALGVGAKAAELAGYTGGRPGQCARASELLSNAQVKEAIAFFASLDDRGSPEFVKATVSALAGASMADFLQKNGTGGWEIDLDKAGERGVLQALKTIQFDKETGRPAGLTLHPPKDYLDMLAKMYGMYERDNEQLRPVLAAPPPTPADARALVAEAAELGGVEIPAGLRKFKETK
jgi:hypothetical protein